MTGVLFRKCLDEWDKELRGQNQQILLLVNNCSAHPQNVQLNNKRLAFFPPNTTALMQPCDQGVIRAVKAHYRRYMCQRIVQQMDESDSSATTCVLAKKINLLRSIELLVMSWEDIKNVTIHNCWCKGCLCNTEVEVADTSDDNSEEVGDILSSEKFDEYININRDLLTCGEVTDEDIIDQVMEGTSIQDSDPEPEDDEPAPIEEPPSNKDIRVSLETLKLGLYSRGFQDFPLIQRIEREVNRKITDSCLQTKVTNFFETMKPIDAIDNDTLLL